MVTVASLRAKLDAKIFTPYGMSTTWKDKTATFNVRGEEGTPTYSESTIVSVPYNTVSGRQSYEVFGALKEGETDAAVKYTVDIDVDDILVIDSINWIVKQVNKNYLTANVVTIVRLVLEQN